MRKICVGSNRLYDNEFSSIFDKELYEFNAQKYFAYNLYFLYKFDPNKFKSKYEDKTLHMILKDKFNINDYYANSILREAKGILDSQIECNKDRKAVLMEHKKQVESKLKDETKKLEKYIKFRDELHKYQINYKNNKKSKFKSNLQNISVKDNLVELRYFYKNKLIIQNYGLYEFEYKYLNNKIRQLRSRIGNLKYRINNLNNKINRKIKLAVFYKKYINTINFTNKKYSQLIISGRADGAFKNYVFKATPINNKFDFEIILKTKTIYLKDIEFKYKGDVLKNILINKIATPVAYKLIRKIDKEQKIYYQIFAIFDIDLDKKNDYTASGVIGIDFNYGHLDFTETDSNGNILHIETINYDITNNSNINKSNLRTAINKIAKYTKDKHKIIVIENLDTSKSKNKSVYRDKKTNKIFHTFAYSEYIDMVEYAGINNGFIIEKVNPFLTSFIGKVKYKNKKLNNHVLASYVIARRGMGFKELVPNKLKYLVDNKRHHWKQWSDIKKAI